MTPLDVLRDGIIACERCPLSREASPVPFQSGYAARVMVVADQADDEAELLQEPFADRAGRLLYNQMAAAGIASSHRTFLLKCKGKSSIKHARMCLDWLTQEISLVSPRVIVAMGKMSAMALLGLPPKFKMADIVGVIKKAPFLPVYVGAWYSPFTVLNSGKDMDRATIRFFEEVRKTSEFA